jgi:hypothetical protein
MPMGSKLESFLLHMRMLQSVYLLIWPKACISPLLIKRPASKRKRMNDQTKTSLAVCAHKYTIAG